MSKLRYEKRTINGKDVYIFEDHSTALLAWSEYRKGREVAPYLITLDHHTDTREAFTSYLCQNYEISQLLAEESSKEIEEQTKRLAAKIDFQSVNTVEAAITILKHDEHIDAAIRSGIVKSAFVICYDDSTGTQSIEENEYSSSHDQFCQVLNPGVVPKPLAERPHTYTVPYGQIFIIGSKYGRNPNWNMRISANVRDHFNMAIEAKYLQAKVDLINEMGNGVGLSNILESDFILDIDLDYFHLRKSIAPTDTSTFYELVRKAGAITIAMESGFVGQDNDDLDSVDFDGEPIISEWLLSQLLNHITNALK